MERLGRHLYILVLHPIPPTKSDLLIQNFSWLDVVGLLKK